MLAGGGSLVRGLDSVLYQATKITTRLAEDPLTAVVRGTAWRRRRRAADQLEGTNEVQGAGGGQGEG